MRILSLTNCPLDSYLGSGKAVLRYTQGLRELGHEVDVFEPQHFEFWSGLQRARQHRQAFGAWRFLKSQLKEKKYDLLEFYGAEFWLAALQVMKLNGRPFMVAHTNGFELLDSQRQRSYSRNGFKTSAAQALRDRYSRIFFQSTDAFVCMSTADCKCATGMRFYSDDFAIQVQHGLDQIYLDAPFVTEKENRIAFMGSWIARKGIKHFVNVMNQILHRFADVSLHLYGTGTENSRILSQFKDVYSNRIVIHGRLSDEKLVESLSKAKIFFFPSQYEGFGLAMAEAMACSCAVVTTRTGFGADVADGTEARLSDFDDEDAMAQSIAQLLTDDRLREQIARNGWVKAHSLNWKSAVQKLSGTYCKWASEFQSSGGVKHN